MWEFDTPLMLTLHDVVKTTFPCGSEFSGGEPILLDLMATNSTRSGRQKIPSQIILGMQAKVSLSLFIFEGFLAHFFAQMVVRPQTSSLKLCS